MTTALISARTMDGLPEAIVNSLGGKAMDAAFSMAEIPSTITFAKSRFIPHRSQLMFMESVAKSAGDRNFGLILASQVSVQKYEFWKDYVLAAETLSDVLARTQKAMVFHGSGQSIKLEQRAKSVFIRYDTSVRGLIGYNHFATCAMQILWTIIEPYMGQFRRPLRMEFDCSATGDSQRYEEFFRCPIKFETPSLGIELRLQDLNRQRTLHSTVPTVLYSDLQRVGARTVPKSFDATVHELLHVNLLEGITDLDVISRQLALGPRTVQRRLSCAGITFRQLSTIARIERALDMLIETRMSVSDISLSLGYADPSHFGRAFRKLTGLTASEVRQGGNQVRNSLKLF